MKIFLLFFIIQLIKSQICDKGFYRLNDDCKECENNYYPFWRFEIVYMNHNNSFHFFNKMKGGLEVKTIEIIKKETAKIDLERNPCLPLIMNAYILNHLNGGN